MNAQQSVLINLLVDIAKAMREMSDDQFEKLAKGELYPSISFKENNNGIKNKSRVRCTVSDKELHNIRTKLDTARTREEGYCIVQDAFPDKERLLAFSKFLDLPVQKKDRIERIREKIVTSTVGRKLSGEAIRGDHLTK